MRFLGFLFLLALVLGGVAYCRGWFDITTSHASGREEIKVGLNQEQIGRDTDRLGKLSQQAVDKLKSIWHKAGPDSNEVEGSVAAVDTADRKVRIDAGTQQLELQVPNEVAIMRGTQTVGFDQLRPGARVKLTLRQSGDSWQLQRIDLLG